MYTARSEIIQMTRVGGAFVLVYAVLFDLTVVGMRNAHPEIIRLALCQPYHGERLKGDHSKLSIIDSCL